METSKVQLEFKCPKSWNSMVPKSNGRFCIDCKKVVKDFSELEIGEVNNSVSASTEKNQCGSFYAYQLDRPFGDWKDRVISFYQRVTPRANSGSLFKPVIALLLFFVMLITGCARRLSGRCIRYDTATSRAKTK